MPVGLDTISNIADVPYYTGSILKYGQFPLWNDLGFLGFPQYASPLTSFYYPVSTIVYFLFGGLEGVKILIPLHMFLSGVGFWIFSSLLTSKKAPRLYGSLLFMISGSLAARIYAGHIQMFMMLPYIPITMYASIKAVETRETRYMALSAISMSLPILMGAPYYFAYLLLMLLVLGAVKIIEYKNNKLKIRKDNLIVVGLILALAFGVSGILSVPILNGNDQFERNVDSLGGSDTVDNIISSFSLGENLDFGTLRMWGYEGKWNWENYSFIGFIPLVLATLSVFTVSRHKNFFYASLVVLIIYAQGSYTNFAWLHFLPFFDKLRVASRILVFIAIILISMAVLGFDWFVESYEKKENISKSIFIIIAFFMIVTGLEYIRNFSSDYNPVKIGILIKILLILGAVYFIFRKYIKDSNILISIVLFSLLALLISNAQLLAMNPFIPADIKSNQDLQEAFIKSGMKNEGPPSIIKGTGNGGLNSLVGYSLNSQNFGYYNIGYGYVYKYRPQSIAISGTQYSTIDYELDYGTFQDFKAVTLKNTLPYAFSVQGNQIIPLKLKYYSPNKISVEAGDIKSGIIVMKNAFHKGWKVDGAKTEDYKGLIAVNADGRQEYDFIFAPDDFYIGALVTIVALVLCAILYIYSPRLRIFKQE
ncbi:MAG TPA: hypothetical protein VIO11_00930 [Candidatus Methanoperedens sp.]